MFSGNLSLRPMAQLPLFHCGQQTRSYAAPAAKTLLTRRAARKLRVGQVRPAIYYKFDCKVELSDGSTYTRRSTFPRVEWRYLADMRNDSRWNPTRVNLKAVETDSTGKLAKFRSKFGEDDDLMDLMGEDVVPVQAGGKVQGKRKK